jgi:mycofactocin precursor
MADESTALADAPTPAPAPVPSADTAGTEAAGSVPAPVEDVLVEEVSIDGMCGVY